MNDIFPILISSEFWSIYISEFYFRIVTVLLIILDVALVITALAKECEGELDGKSEDGVETTMPSLGPLTPLPDKSSLPSEISNWYDLL